MATSPLPKVEKETLLRGDSRFWTETFTDDDTGTAIDMSGWGDWLCQIRDDLDRGTVVATITVDASSAASGIITRELTADQADLLPGQTDPDTKPIVYIDLQATRTSDSFKQTWKRWKATVEGDVSDD